VESTVLPVALPQTYSAQVYFSIIRELHIKEKVDGVVTYAPAFKIQVDPLKPRKKIPIPAELLYSYVPRKIKKAMSSDIYGSSGTNELSPPIEVVTS
jgi:hypothetical protein